ncbi:MAG: NUDIX hydrolase [Rubrobacter sp.]|nr:NUDIX hydrolase [Rubrobacter sp.]
MPPPETPKLTVDIVAPMEGGIVLIKRKNEPFEGMWAFPGGFVDIGETVEDAAVREMKEETGLDVELVRLVGVYSEPNRDPRGHNVSVAFLANVVGGEMKADTDAEEVEILDPNSVELAFDHAEVVSDALGG